jgi:predicted DNA-binding protein with PD1-like motif
MKAHAFRLTGGADLRESIEAWVRSSGIHAGCVLACVGSLSRAVLRMPGATDFLDIERDIEIVSMEGTLSPDGCHVHVAVSDRTGAVLGGHLVSGCTVRTTAEIVLAEVESHDFRREHDSATGFAELVVWPRPRQVGSDAGAQQHDHEQRRQDGHPHRKPRPTSRATNSGARAVPSPRARSA